jgi:glycosyltransferase involved in cell wall biosynthesis
MYTTKKNVLIVVPSLKRGGGAERVAAMVGSGLKESGGDAHFLTFYDFRPQYDFSGKYISLNEPLKSNLFVKVFNQFKRAYKIRRYCRSNDINTVISFMEEANFATCLSRIFFNNQSNIICSVRNNTKKNSHLYKSLMGWLYPHADVVVAISRGVEKLLQENFGLQNTTTIYNPIDAGKASRLAEKPLPEEYRDFFASGFNFISIGRLTHQKGQSHLIRCFAAVAESNPEAKLAILGKGELREQLQKLIADCGLEDKVYLFGNQENVFSFLRSADQFVLSSLWEGMGNVILESLAVGKSVVSTDCVAGPREILAPCLDISESITYPYTTDCGTLTPPFNEDHIFKSPDEKSLTEAEEVFAEEMKQAIIRKSDDLNPELYLQSFSQKKIIKDWMKVASRIDN